MSCGINDYSDAMFSVKGGHLFGNLLTETDGGLLDKDMIKLEWDKNQRLLLVGGFLEM
jgi:hypothetical protein